MQERRSSPKVECSQPLVHADDQITIIVKGLRKEGVSGDNVVWLTAPCYITLDRLNVLLQSNGKTLSMIKAIC